MQVIYSEGSIIFKFTPMKKLIISKKESLIEYWNGKIPFSAVRGFWKNYHPKGKKMVYYVMVLTPKKIHKVTPEIRNEKVIDGVLERLEEYIPLGGG